jgi:hypothetical protein
MIPNVKIEAVGAMAAVDWITALKSGAVATLVNAGRLQPDLFDERNLISFTSEDYPSERLVACRNPELAKLRAAKRKDLIAATRRELEKVADMVAAGALSGRDKIGARVGEVIGKHLRRPGVPPPRSQSLKPASLRWRARLELSRAADPSCRHRAQYHAPQGRKARNGNLHPHHRGQPKTAASPRSGRRYRGVDSAAQPVSIAND